MARESRAERQTWHEAHIRGIHVVALLDADLRRTVKSVTVRMSPAVEATFERQPGDEPRDVWARALDFMRRRPGRLGSRLA